MDTDDIDGLAFEDTVREILDPIYFLGSGNTATDDGDVGVIQTNGELEMICYIAEPRFP
jgi:hypothetical protein